MGSGIQEPTIEQKQIAFRIIQEELNKTEYKRLVGKIPNDNRNLMIKDNSISFAKPKNGKTERSFNWLDVIYNRIATNRIGDIGEFFHFKSFERALQLITQQSLLLFSLDSQSENDYAELSEWVRFKITRPKIEAEYPSGKCGGTCRKGTYTTQFKVRFYRNHG